MMTEQPTLAESAPSRVRADEPTFARWVGGIGWGIIMVGIAVVMANRASETPRLVPQGWGWLFLLAGTTMALIHASLETDLLLRRLLGCIGAALVVIGIGWGAAMIAKEESWARGLFTIVPGICLLSLYLRREDDDAIRQPALLGFGGVGLLLCLIGVVGTIFDPAHMPARWSVAMAFGPILMLLYLGMAGATSERAFQATVALGIIGAIAFVWGLMKPMVLDVRYEWQTPSTSTALAALAVGVCIAVFGFIVGNSAGKTGAGGEASDSAKNLRKWGRIGLATGGIMILLGVLRYLAPNMLSGAESAGSYLVPTGFTLMLAGVIYGMLALGYASENRLVVLTRRELTAFFVSPIVYFVFAGFVFIAMVSYFIFIERAILLTENNRPMSEPIIRNYVVDILPVVAVIFSVPLLTMRLFSEEKRTGTMEVLLTAPVGDWLIVLSKFFAAWVFFVLTWMPWWLFLLALRLVTGLEFDFRPMIGFSIALAVCGASFIAMGEFFSSLTNNQIIAAALSFMGMMVLLGFYFAGFLIQSQGSLADSARAIMRTFSFIEMWSESTDGKLFVKDIVAQLSLAVFWLFATTKVLEVRRWS